MSLVAAELASAWPGGVYNWVEEGISAPAGLLAVSVLILAGILVFGILPPLLLDRLRKPEWKASAGARKVAS